MVRPRPRRRTRGLRSSAAAIGRLERSSRSAGVLPRLTWALRLALYPFRRREPGTSSAASPTTRLRRLPIPRVTIVLKAILASAAGLALGLWATAAMLANGGPFDMASL